MTESASRSGRSRMTPKQQVLKAFQHACMGTRNGKKGPFAVKQSVISWGEPVGADGRTPREAWAMAAANLPNWRRFWRTGIGH